MRCLTGLLLVALLAVASCSRLSGAVGRGAENLVPLTDVPAEYGELVSVTYAPQAGDEYGWRELWFENEATGLVTYVPVLLPDLKYDPDLVRTVVRTGLPAATGGDQ
jgi:hypothetical protein